MSTTTRMESYFLRYKEVLVRSPSLHQSKDNKELVEEYKGQYFAYQLTLVALANYLGNIPLKTWPIELLLYIFNC